MSAQGVAVAGADYVIVGAGSAGALLAARLSEDPGCSVLLVEAGSDHSSADTPSGVAGMDFFEAWDVPGRLWSGLDATRAEGQSPVLYRRGKGVGGSSAVNGMIAMRGIPEDYDSWARDFGCTGWDWASLRSAFCAIEDDREYGGDGDHGLGGPIPLQRLPLDQSSALDRATRRALVALGFTECDDYHAPGATGVSRGACSIRDGRRISSNDAFLEPARGRPNLTIVGGCLVDRVAVDGNRVVGVRSADGEEIEAGEVILAAGAIHTPAILLRSDIGPNQGLAVGSNLTDHAVVNILLHLCDSGRSRAGGQIIQSILRYTSGLADAGDNDMQLIWFSQFGAGADAIATGLLMPLVGRVFSRGWVTLQSPDPRVDPVVEFNMLSDERDLIRLREGVRLAVRVLDQPVMRDLVVSTSAGPRPDVVEDDDLLDQWLKRKVSDCVHAVGTCRMGSHEDPDAVVDPECRVRGYNSLRICDASIMPDLPRAPTNHTTVAIAERLAGIIR